MKLVRSRIALLSSAIVVLCSAGLSLSSYADDNAVPAGTKADNSAVNKRDQNPGQLTADQQTSGTSDTEITRQIRRQITKDGSLSVYAHNVKIITAGGAVTLKGPVRSSAEKQKVEQFAKSVAGVSSVENLLSVKR